MIYNPNPLDSNNLRRQHGASICWIAAHVLDQPDLEEPSRACADLLPGSTV